MEHAESTAPPPPSSPGCERPSPSTERTIAALTHLSGFLFYVTLLGHLIAPLVVYLVYRGRSAAIAHHAREALNFQLSLTIYAIVSGVLTLVLIGVIGLALLPIFGAIFMIVAAVQASDGVRFRYPLTIRLVQ